jgi:hypothetical protein
MLTAIALLRADLAEKGYGAVREFLREKKLLRKLQDLLSYFKRQWLKKEGPQSFSVYRRKHRTNNSIESFHSALMRDIKTPHPSIWKMTGRKLVFKNQIKIMLYFKFLECLAGQSLTGWTALNALKNNKKISKDRKLQYLLQDIAIKKATISLDEEEISVREFLEKTCKHTFNPARTSLYEPRRPLKRKRPMPAQNEDSDSV